MNMHNSSQEELAREVARRLSEAQGLATLVGAAPSFLKVLGVLPAVARGQAAALICGETGTGKELVARALHYLSARAAFPFVPVNCGALPETLLEDELFGHERGAFTDAHTRRLGLLAQAEKGTLFLDEVDALSARAQVALLRVLQDKRFRPIGASGERQADVRIIAATNVRLEKLVETGRLRADLYYRLSILTLQLPPLRERQQDIIPLAHHFLHKHALPERSAPELSPAALAALLAYDWPGNVRELENAIIRGLYLSPIEIITADALGIPLTAPEQPPPAPHATAAALSFRARKQNLIEAFERDYLTQLLAEHQGNVSRAARAAGKERRDLGKLLKKYQIDPRGFRVIQACSS